VGGRWNHGLERGLEERSDARACPDLNR
jgi:hypothetical protein